MITEVFNGAISSQSCKVPFAHLIVKLDTKITSKLKKEGQIRDLIRQIQEARKKANCQLNEFIIVYLPSWPKEFEDEIKRKALVKELRKGQCLKILTS